MHRPTEVAPGVYRLGSDVVNWYLVENGAGRLTAVDAGFPGFERCLEQDVRAIGHGVEDIAALVLTHADQDHTGLARRLQQAGASVHVHEDDAAFLRDPGAKGGDARAQNLLVQLWRPELWRIAYDGIRNGITSVGGVEGADTFGDRDELPGGLRAVHTPGHTAGHCVLLLEDRGVLFAGDALCTHEWMTSGSTITLMPSFFNVDNEGAIESLGIIEELSAHVILPGHGDPWHGSAAAAAERARAAAGAPRRRFAVSRQAGTPVAGRGRRAG